MKPVQNCTGFIFSTFHMFTCLQFDHCMETFIGIFRDLGNNFFQNYQIGEVYGWIKRQKI